MAKNNNNMLGIAAVAVGLGLVGWSFLGSGTGTSTNPYNIPANGTAQTPWGSWTNTTGQPVWMTATGIIVNGAGNLIGNVADLIAALNAGNNNSGTGSGNVMLGTKKRVAGLNNNAGEYYNPLPGGLM